MMFPMSDLQIQTVRDITDITDTSSNIFKSMYTNFINMIPWDTSITWEQMSTMYYYHSGLKRIHFPMAKDISEGRIQYVSFTILTMLSPKWKKEYEVLNLDYDPIENVNMDRDITSDTERDSKKTIYNKDILDESVNHNEREDIKSSSDNQTSFNEKTNSNSNINNNSKSIETVSSNDNTISVSNSEQNSLSDENIYGFNSSSASNSNDTVDVSSENSKNTEHNITDSKTDNSSSENNTSSSYDSKNSTQVEKEHEYEFKAKNYKDDRNYTKLNDEQNTEKDQGRAHHVSNYHGLDGKYTPQQMIEEELNLRKKIFFDMVFDDIDRLITIPCY